MLARVSDLAAAVWFGAAAAAQGDLGPLLARVPDAAVMVAAAADPAGVAASLTGLLDPLPAGLPDVLTTRIGVGLTAARLALEGPPVEWVHRMAGGGLVVAVLRVDDADTERIAILRPPDLAAAEAWCARHAPWLPRAGAGDLLLLGSSRAVVERLRQEPADAVGRWQSPAAWHAAARTGVGGSIDLAALRTWRGAALPHWDRAGAAARFVFAPVLHVLGQASRLDLGLQVDASRLQLQLEADTSLRATPLGGLLTSGPAPTLAPPADGLASLGLARSLRALLADPQAFLPDDGVRAVQGFLSIADALDGPRTSFVDDLVGGLREPIQLCVLAPATADEGDISPLVLPEFALVAELEQAATAESLFRAAAAFVTIVNAERAQRGEAPFLVRRRQDETGHGLVAEPPPWRGPGLAPLDRQLSPTLWVGGGRIALASTQRAARHAITQTFGIAADGDRLVLRGPAIAAVVAGSRAALELARMLDEGESRGDAAQFFAALIAVAGAIDELRAAVVPASTDTRLQLEVERRR